MVPVAKEVPWREGERERESTTVAADMTDRTERRRQNDTHKIVPSVVAEDRSRRHAQDSTATILYTTVYCLTNRDHLRQELELHYIRHLSQCCVIIYMGPSMIHSDHIPSIG